MKRIVVLLSVAALAFASCTRDNGVITLTMASTSVAEDTNVRGFLHFADLVEERSEGRIRVNVLHSGQLGGHRDNVEQMQMGTLEMAEINVAVLSAFDPTFMVFDMPYLTRGVDHVRGLLDDGWADYLSDSLESRAGVKIIGWQVRTPRNMYISTRPIHTVEDFAGMRVRIMESPAMLRAFELLGAVPVIIPATERFMALQTGVVDAAENAITLILTEREFEVTRYVSLTEHFFTPNAWTISAAFFNGLPQDLQQIVLEAADEASRWASQLDQDVADEVLVELANLGMIINAIDDKTPFIQAVAPLHAEFRDQIGAHIMDAFAR